MDILFAFIGAGSGGSFIAIGAAANARLRQTLHSPIGAAAINFIVGFTTIALLIITGVFSPENLVKLANVPLWAFAGGLLGAIYVTLNTIVMPRLGLTTTTLAVVCSQMILSLVIDQLGWFGIIPQPMNPSKVVAIGLLLLAIALTQLDNHPRQIKPSNFQ